MKAIAEASTTTLVIPHPRAAGGRARALNRERHKHRYQRIEERLLAALERLEDLRDEYIARLDLLAGDPDLEDDELEANLGGNGSWQNQPVPDEAEADDADDEPSLGAPEGAQAYNSQRCGDHLDHEEQCDDEGNDGGDREWDPCDHGEPEDGE